MPTVLFSKLNEMNKWQVICPLVLLLAIGLWGVHEHSQNHVKGYRNAIERHLQSILAELENHQDRGRFPTVEAARTILDSEEGKKALHSTSLFTIRDLLYNPTQPAVGSNEIILCADVGETLYSIRANRAVSQIPADSPHLAGFVRVAKPEDLTVPQPSSVSNR